MLLFGALMLSSVSSIANNTYNEVFQFDYQAVLSDGFSLKQTDDAIIDINAAVNTPLADVDADSQDDELKFYGYDANNNQYIKLANGDDEQITNDQFDDGIIITTTTAQKYDLEVGDTLSIVNPYDINEDIEFVVNDINNEIINSEAFVNIDYLQNQLDLSSNYANGEVGNGDDYQKYQDIDSNVQILETIDLQDTLNEQLGVFYTMIAVIASLAAIIAFVSLLTITSIIIDSNYKTISVMKVLGYTTKEINNMTTSAYKWVVIVVYFVSLPLLENLIQGLINYAMRDIDFQIVVKIDLKFAFGGFIIIYLVFMLSSIISKRAVHKIKLSESLKTDE